VIVVKVPKAAVDSTAVLHLLVVALGYHAVDAQGLNHAIGGLFGGVGALLAPNSHGAAVAGGRLIHVQRILVAGDVGSGVLSEGDGVAEGLIAGRGLHREAAAGLTGLQDGLGRGHPCGQLGGHVDGLQESFVVLILGEDEFSFHFVG